jgi:hypothetical protein
VDLKVHLVVLVEEQMAEHLQLVLVMLEVFHLLKVIRVELQLVDVLLGVEEEVVRVEPVITERLVEKHLEDLVAMDQVYQLHSLDQPHLHMEHLDLMEVKDISLEAEVVEHINQVAQEVAVLVEVEQLINLAQLILVVEAELEDLQDTLLLLFLQAVDLV